LKAKTLRVDYDLLAVMEDWCNGGFLDELDLIGVNSSWIWKFRAEETPNFDYVLQDFITDFVYVVQHEHMHRVLLNLKECEANAQFDNLHLNLRLAF